MDSWDVWWPGGGYLLCSTSLDGFIATTRQSKRCSNVCKGYLGLPECISAAPEQQSPRPDSTRCNASSPKGVVAWLDVGRVDFGLGGVGPVGSGQGLTRATSGQMLLSQMLMVLHPGPGKPVWDRGAILWRLGDHTPSTQSTLCMCGRTMPGGPMLISADERTIAGGPVSISGDQRTIAGGPMSIPADQRTIARGPVSISGDLGSTLHGWGASSIVSSRTLGGAGCSEHDVQ